MVKPYPVTTRRLIFYLHMCKQQTAAVIHNVHGDLLHLTLRYVKYLCHNFHNPQFAIRYLSATGAGVPRGAPQLLDNMARYILMHLLEFDTTQTVRRLCVKFNDFHFGAGNINDHIAERTVRREVVDRGHWTRTLSMETVLRHLSTIVCRSVYFPVSAVLLTMRRFTKLRSHWTLC